MTKRSYLWLILIAALALRAAMWTAAVRDPARVFTPDSQGYWDIARQMLVEGRFDNADSRPEIFRTPGYPALLAISHLPEVIGLGDSKTLWPLALALQVLLDVGLVYLTYRLAGMLVSPPAAMLAAALQAISPLAVASSCRILSDGLYAFLFILALLAMTAHLRGGRRWLLAASAAALAAACYVRPVAMVMAIVFAVVLLTQRGRPLGASPLGANLARTAIFAGVFVACVASWVIRNAAVADYAGFSSSSGDSAYNFAAAEVIARTKGIDGMEARRRMRLEDERFMADPVVTSGEAARRRSRRATEIIAAHPALYARIHLQGIVGFWMPGATDVLEVAGLTHGNRNTLDVLRREGPAAAARNYFAGNWWALLLVMPMAAILAFKYLAAGLCGAVRLRPHMGAAAWLAAAAVVVSMLLPGPYGLPRYRIPVEPIVNIAAAAGAVIAIGLLRRAKKT